MYLRNAWYIAGWSGDLDDGPVGRTLLEEPVVLFRGEDAEPIALTGRCPHRFAPLHLGKVSGDTISCPYHGLVFGASGQCLLNPHGDGFIPEGAKLKRYTLHEKDGILWIWMGDPARADPATIIDTSFMTDPAYAVVTGSIRVGANYQLVIDNLLDLTHPAILHQGGLSSEEYQGEKMQHDFRQEGVRIHSDYTFLDVNASPALANLWNGHKTDVRAFMTLTAPSNLDLDFRMSEVNGPPDEGLLMPSLHLIVPVDERNSYYFYAMGRNVQLDNEELTAFTGEMARRAFEDEDEPMIRACQEMMGTTDLFSLRPVVLKTDVAAVRARHMLRRLMDRESAGEDVPEAEPATA
jgi:vanillate O-demethylase monooxygenase subunit